MFSSYRNQSVDLLCKSTDWFLHNGNISRWRVKPILKDKFWNWVLKKLVCWEIFQQKFQNSPLTLLTRHFKQCFSQNAKLADVTPGCKEKGPELVENHRPVSVLPSVSKIFETVIQKQISCHVKDLLSRFMCRHRKGFSSQYAVLYRSSKGTLS